MSEDPLFNNSRTQPYGDDGSSSISGWRKSVIVTIIAFLLATSGFTIFTFISILQKDPPEKRGVEFPFSREVIVPFSFNKNTHTLIEDIAGRSSSSGDFIEIVLQNENLPLFMTDIVKDPEKSLPRSIESSITNFSIGSLKGEPFFLISFNTNAFPLMSEYSEEIFSYLSHFTGKTSTREIDRLKRANTLVILRNENTVYGYLNKNIIAITENEDAFLDILKRYRSI